MKRSAAPVIPTAPGALPLIGHSLALLRQPWTFLESLSALDSGLVRVRIGPMATAVVVCDPVLTQQVLRNDRVFDKGGPLFEVARHVVGDNVITASHDAHRRQRRLIQPAFHRGRLPGYVTAMSREIDAVTDRWRDGETIDVLSEMLHITLRSFLAAMFSESLTPAALDHALSDVTTIVAGLYRQVLLPRPLDKLPTRRNLRYHRARAGLRRLVDRIVDKRLDEGADHGDLLSSLIAAHGGAARCDRDSLHDQLTAFFIAGSETTASALAWALYLLSRHPTTWRAVQLEADRVSLDGHMRYGHASELTTTRRVLAETLRLYPPGWLFTRTVTTETLLGGYRLAPGTAVVYSPYLLHRLPTMFREPSRFDPDRWDADPGLDDCPSYIPFGAGARRCAGEHFALAEATLTLATIARRWQLLPSSMRPVRPAVAMALRPRAFRLRVMARTHAESGVAQS
ncbi:cytochrome P450 [Nocardia asteroides]|nr:cytochrome P450 [Nocardia asteroides]